MTKPSELIAIGANVATSLGLIATTVALFVAGCALRENTQQTRATNTTAILADGLRLDREYYEGKTDEREVISFYYQVFYLNDRGRLERELIRPLLFSLCTFLLTDRAEDYWKEESKEYYWTAFVDHMDSLLSERQCA